MNRLLQIKNASRKRRPNRFTRSDTPGKKRIPATPWRRPKGLHNKVKDQRRGHKVMPNVGYGTPRSLRGANTDGMFLVRVETIAQLQAMDKKTQVAIFSASLGGRKRMELLKKASELGITVRGVKDASAKAQSIADATKKRQADSKNKVQSRKQKREQKQKVKTQKEALKEKAESASKDKAEEKKELDKLLTKAE